MGFSTIAASIILFAGLLFLSGTVANALFEAQRDNGREEAERFEREELRRNTELRLDSITWQGNRIHVYITNVGDTTLDVDHIHVFRDGDYGTDTIQQRTVGGNANTGFWAPQEQLYLRLDGPKPTRVYVVTETGIGVTGVL